MMLKITKVMHEYMHNRGGLRRPGRGRINKNSKTIGIQNRLHIEHLGRCGNRRSQSFIRQTPRFAN